MKRFALITITLILFLSGCGVTDNTSNNPPPVTTKPKEEIITPVWTVKNYVDEFHTYAMDWRPEGITFYVDGKKVAQTEESPQYRMCMILSMYINSDFSGWDEPENEYPIEWLIDYVRVYKDINGYA